VRGALKTVHRGTEALTGTAQRERLKLAEEWLKRAGATAKAQRAADKHLCGRRVGGKTRRRVPLRSPGSKGKLRHADARRKTSACNVDNYSAPCAPTTTVHCLRKKNTGRARQVTDRLALRHLAVLLSLRSI
jgi:hypothetical protein